MKKSCQILQSTQKHFPFNFCHIATLSAHLHKYCEEYQSQACCHEHVLCILLKISMLQQVHQREGHCSSQASVSLKKWKNKLSTWIFTGGNFSKILLLSLSYNSLQKGKLKIDHSKTSVLGLHRPETMENIGCIRLLPPRLVQDITSIYLLFGK